MAELKAIDDVIDAISQKRIQEHRYVNVELKEEWDKRNGDKISALANRLDQLISFLIVGVADSGRLTDHSEKWAKKTEEIISQQINQYLDPIQSCRSVSCREIHGSWVVIVTIQNAGEVTYWGEHAHVASGTTTKEMEPEEILKLRIQLPGLIDYSKQHHKSYYQDPFVQRFGAEIAKKSHPLESVGFTAQDSVTLLKSLGLFERQAARILFGRSTYRIVRYDEAGEPISNEKKEGLFNLLLPEFIKGLCRDGDECFSERALKEALANAVAHAAYFENDGEVTLELFSDSIAVSNLCIKELSFPPKFGPLVK